MFVGSGNSGNSTNYAVLRRRLNLTQDDVNEQNPTDITYVHRYIFKIVKACDVNEISRISMEIKFVFPILKLFVLTLF